MPNDKELRPGAITDEEWVAWRTYRARGGLLDLYEWVDAGRPGLDTEAIRSYKQDVRDYLDREVKEGRLALEEGVRLAGEAFGQVGLEGLHKELPHFKEIQEQKVVGQDIERQAEAIEKAKIEKSAAFYGVTPEAFEKVSKAYEGKPGLAGYMERREEAQEKRASERAQLRQWQVSPPEPRYAPAFEEERAGLVGAQPWRQWFEGKYSREVGRFQAMQTREMYKKGYWPRPGWEEGEPEFLTPREAEKEMEKTWAQYLKKRTPELREEWYGLGPSGRGERPWAYAPKIRTVRF